MMIRFTFYGGYGELIRMCPAKPKPSRKNALSRSEKIAIPIIIIIAIWVVYSLSQPGVPSSPSTTAQTTGTMSAPDFTLPIVSGKGLTDQSITLSSLRGKIVLLEFMEPWCPHCQHMAPVLEKLYAQYGKNNVVFISISGPWQGATADDTAHFINDYGSSWTYVFDTSGTVMSEFGVNSTPVFLIIGKDGSIVARYEGELTYDTLAAGLTSAMTS